MALKSTTHSLIKTILFSRLRNESHYEFLAVFRQLITSFKDVNDLLTPFFIPFDPLLALEQQLIDSSRKSHITGQLVEADQRIDRGVTGLKAVIFAALHHYDPAHVEAARILDEYLKPFGRIRYKSYGEESAAVQKLVRDLLQTFGPQVTILGLGGWVEEINLAEVEFTQLFAQRNAEQADRPQEDTRNVRHDLEAGYYKMTTVVEADVNLNGDAKCGEFILQLNNQIKYFNEHAHHPARHDLANAVVAPTPVQTYTGKAITPIPEVHYVEEGHPTVELVFTVDFTLTYRDNVNVGDAEIIISGKGAYKGKKTVTFNIARTI